MAITRAPAERVGDIVRRLREERGLGVGELAELAGLTRWTVTRIEAGQGRPRGATLGRIARALGVSLTQIRGEQVQGRDAA